MTSRTVASDQLAEWVVMMKDFDDLPRGLRVRLPRSIALELVAAGVAAQEVRPASPPSRPTTRGRAASAGS